MSMWKQIPVLAISGNCPLLLHTSHRCRSGRALNIRRNYPIILSAGDSLDRRGLGNLPDLIAAHPLPEHHLAKFVDDLGTSLLSRKSVNNSGDDGLWVCRGNRFRHSRDPCLVYRQTLWADSVRTFQARVSFSYPDRMPHHTKDRPFSFSSSLSGDCVITCIDSLLLVSIFLNIALRVSCQTPACHVTCRLLIELNQFTKSHYINPLICLLTPKWSP